MLRPDLLSHTVSGETGNVALTCFFLSACRVAALRGGTLPDLTPAAQLVDKWVLNRLTQMGNGPVALDPNVEEWRVVAAVVFMMDAPREQTKGGERLGTAT